MGTYSSVGERWKLLVSAWRESGLSAAAFCRRQQVPAKRFYLWRKRLSSLPEFSPATGGPEPAGFVRMRFAERSAGCGIAVVLDGGVRLDLSPGFDAGELARAVRALRGVGTC
ncbi:MAG: IS66 family insertion sequence element accessory protein TnpB [Lentisphaeria bacterium]|jgi:hypothetical protein|nr:IS66 family insertion sequence element accessory protein TnpB [Lentisphaeria bacterium]